MQFWSILPTKFIPYMKFSPYNKTLVLANLIQKGNEYVKSILEFKEQRGFVIMDNGFYENKKNPTTEELVRKAKLIKADAIVLQDLSLSDNLKYVVNFTIKKMKRLGFKGKFLMCVWAQNKDLKLDVENFKVLLSTDLDIIAIPYSFDEEFMFRRTELLSMIDKEIKAGRIKESDLMKKHIHLFGICDINDIEKEKRSWVKSIDSTLAFKCGYYKLKLPVSVENDPKRPKNFFDINKLSKEQIDCIEYNLHYIKELCNIK